MVVAFIYTDNCTQNNTKSTVNFYQSIFLLFIFNQLINCSAYKTLKRVSDKVSLWLTLVLAVQSSFHYSKGRSPLQHIGCLKMNVCLLFTNSITLHVNTDVESALYPVYIENDLTSQNNKPRFIIADKLTNFAYYRAKLTQKHHLTVTLDLKRESVGVLSGRCCWTLTSNYFWLQTTRLFSWKKKKRKKEK